MSARPDIELALDVRSYEKVVVISAQDSTFKYPDHWVKPARLSELDDMTLGGNDLYRVNPEYPLAMSVVVIDRVDVHRKTLTQLAEKYPRLITFAIASVDHEKQVRRMLTSLFPWSEVWTVYTSFGKLLVTKDAVGVAYDRSRLIDQRPEAAA